MSDLFISYAHQNEERVERLVMALSQRGRDVWIDKQGIEPADHWKRSAIEAIEGSDAFVFVLSRSSLASEPCLGELEQAMALNKRVIAICVEEAVRALSKPDILDELSWIMLRPEDDFEAGVERLVHALDTDLEVVRTHTRILVRARAWELTGRRVSPLLRGEELAAAEEWLSRAGLGGGPAPTELQREFIRASRRVATRRQRTIAGISALAAVVAIALSVFALIQRSQAIGAQKIAQSRLLASETELTLASDASVSTLLALKALGIRHTAQAEQALRDALEQLQTLVVLRGHTAQVNDAAYSRDGARIVTASDDGTARVWSARSGAQLAILKDPSGLLIKSASFSADGSRIVTTGADGTVRIWNAGTASQLRVLAHRGSLIHSATFSPDGSRVLTASFDGTARIYDARDGAQLAVLTEHRGLVNSAQYSPDGSLIVSAGTDGTARIWNAQTGAQLRRVTARGGLISATFSPDGSRLLTVSYAGKGQVRDAQSGALLASFDEAEPSAAFSPDGSKIVTGGAALRIFNAHTGARLFTYATSVGGVNSATFSPDGSRLLTADADGTARVWSAHAGGAVQTFVSSTIIVQPSTIRRAAFSPDASTVVTAGMDGTVRIYDARDGAQLLVLRGHTGYVEDAAFSADGSRVVTAGNDGTARIWDARTGHPLLTLKAPTVGRFTSPFVAAAFSPDGTRIVTTGIGESRIWNAQAGALLLHLQGNASVSGGAFSPDGSQIITSSYDGTAHIWNARTGAQILVLNARPAPLTSATFSVDGSRVVTVGTDDVVRVWDARTGAQLLSLTGHTGVVNDAVFSRNGSRIVTASADETTRIWDARTGVELLSLKGGTGAVNTAVYSPDGSEVLTAGPDSAAHIWSTELAGPLPSLERIARSLVTRGLTSYERRRYLTGIAP